MQKRIEKIGASYLFSKSKKQLQDIDKNKCAILLSKAYNKEALNPKFIKELQKKKNVNLQKVIEGMNYDDIIKNFGFKKVSNNVYGMSINNNDIIILITIDFEKEKLQKILKLDINNEEDNANNEETDYDFDDLQEALEEYITSNQSLNIDDFKDWLGEYKLKQKPTEDDWEDAETTIEDERSMY